MIRVRCRNEQGAALIIGLIMLVLITLMLISAVNIGSANFRSVSNMQFRAEAIAAANQAIDQVVSSPFYVTPAAETIGIDVNNDGTDDYEVSIALPVCVSAAQASSPPPSSVSLGPSMTLDPTWNTVWEIDATVTATGNVGQAGARVHSGVRQMLTQVQKNIVCG